MRSAHANFWKNITAVCAGSSISASFLRRVGAVSGLAAMLTFAAPATARPPLAPIAFVPLDDRPVTRQLPLMLGEIAGRTVMEPPQALLGNYIQLGSPDAIVQWLEGEAASRSDTFVASSDMLAYGGLIASRVPGTTYAQAYARLQSLAQLRRERPRAWIASFATIMRLAPTGVPATRDAPGFFAAYPVWTYLAAYANLHDPPLPSEEQRAAHLRALIGDATLRAYLDTRYRNYAVNRALIDLAANGTLDRVALGQDDAGPVGLHVRDVRALRAAVDGANVGDRVSIEPGADELGMALVAHALARGADWTPRIAVRYSASDGASFQDPLEFAPIATTIGALIDLCGGVSDQIHPDIVLYVRVPKMAAAQDNDLLKNIASDEQAGASVAFADLSFLNSYAAQAAFAKRLLDAGAASRLDAYASWNTNANTVGTALAEAIAVGSGKRLGTYDALAHKRFTFNRFLDDYIYHDEVRPDLNATLTAQGVVDHTYLTTDVAAPLAERNRALLWNRGETLLAQLYPGFHIAAIDITLPWDRTFETGIDARIAPNL
jgi:hypothetical protein